MASDLWSSGSHKRRPGKLGSLKRGGGQVTGGNVLQRGHRLGHPRGPNDNRQCEGRGPLTQSIIGAPPPPPWDTHWLRKGVLGRDSDLARLTNTWGELAVANCTLMSLGLPGPLHPTSGLQGRPTPPAGSGQSAPVTGDRTYPLLLWRPSLKSQTWRSLCSPCRL